MEPRRPRSRRSEPAGDGKEPARALTAKAWRSRWDALGSPPADEAALATLMAQVEADLVRACEISRQAGASKELSVALGKRGHVALDLNQPGKARTLFEDSVAVAREAGDPLRLAHAVRHLGQVNQRVGPARFSGTVL